MTTIGPWDASTQQSQDKGALHQDLVLYFGRIDGDIEFLVKLLTSLVVLSKF